MRCLILGGNGFLGSSIITACDDRGFGRLGTWFTRPHSEHVPLDIRDAIAVSDLLADYQPDVVIHAAGISSHGYAEINPGICRQIVVDGTERLAAAVRQHGGRLVYFSRDEVFGECSTAKRENDPVVPGSVLARCHAEAEDAIRSMLPEQHLIVRTGWVFGPGGQKRTLGGRIASRLLAGKAFPAATDRQGQPTFAPDLASAVLELAQRETTGTIHLVGPERHTEFSFARQIAFILRLDAELVEELPAMRILGDSERPNCSWLDRAKLRELLGPRAIRSVADGYRAMQTRSVPQIHVRAA